MITFENAKEAKKRLMEQLEKSGDWKTVSGIGIGKDENGSHNVVVNVLDDSFSSQNIPISQDVQVPVVLKRSSIPKAQ